MEVAEKKKKKMQELPNDVIIEILSWIPAKSLLRLRWTCKFLFDLIIRDHDFIKMHLHRRSSDSVLSFYFMDSPFGYLKLYQAYYLNYNDTNHHVLRDVSRSEVIRIDHPSLSENIHSISGYSNGLILLKVSNKYLSGILNLCILNPCTKEYVVLRRQIKSLVGETYGFGYDQTMDDYKVIRIFHYKMHMHVVDLSHSEVEVYTLGTSSWRWIGPCPYQLYSSPGVFMNGALYWMDFGHENIISIDLGKEEFRHVAKAPNHDVWHIHDYSHKLQVFEGSLCLVLTTTYYQQNTHVEIWVMKDCTTVNNNNESLLWTKLVTITDIEYFPIKPLRYTRNGEILTLKNHTDLVLYDPKNTRDPKTLCRIREDYNRFSVGEVYIESLVSLNSRTYAS